MIYQASALDSQSFLSEETEGECYAAAASILRGDYGPGGCDDIMGESIFGGDMGHWWWWWCVSTWGFPSAWGRTRSQDKKKYLKASEVLTPSRWPVCGRSQSFVQTAITRTQAYLERPYLSPPQPLFPTVEPPAVTLTAAKQSMRKQFPPTRSGGCFLNHLKNWISNVTFRRVGQESRVHGVKILNERVSMITVGHYRSTDKTQMWRSHDAQTYWDVSVPSALCFILLKTNVLCLRSHQIKCLLKRRTVTCFIFVTLYINVLIISVGYT